jgi:alkylation response protein AidB-like acyl-CoA dehydrogenase
MHFAFTAQQIEFRDAVRQVLAKECTTEDVRRAYDAPPDRPAGNARWATLAELGVIGLTVPEDQGGLGLDLVDLVLLVEAAGRVALPEPLGTTAGIAAPLLRDLTTDATGATIDGLLADIATGTRSAAVADVRWPDTPVAGADGADTLLLVRQGAEGPEIHVVDRSQATVTAVPSLDPTRRLGIPAWESSDATVLATGTRARDALSATADRAAVVSGAELLGLADAMIDLTAAYAKDRQQFGQPIGSFQAVKHLLAGAVVLLEFARPAVYGAAWCLDVGAPDASRSASVAKAYASDAASEAARVALQVHGAIGYTWECDLHLYLKRTWALAEAWGSAADHRARVLGLLLDGR